MDVSTAPVLTSNGHSDPSSNLLIAVQHMSEEHPASMIDTLSKPDYTHLHRASGGTAGTVRSLRKPAGPSWPCKSFVDCCGRERGYEVAGCQEEGELIWPAFSFWRRQAYLPDISTSTMKLLRAVAVSSVISKPS